MWTRCYPTPERHINDIARLAHKPTNHSNQPTMNQKKQPTIPINHKPTNQQSSTKKSTKQPQSAVLNDLPSYAPTTRLVMHPIIHETMIYDSNGNGFANRLWRPLWFLIELWSEESF